MIVGRNDRVAQGRDNRFLRLGQHARPGNFLLQQIWIGSDARHGIRAKRGEVERSRQRGGNENPFKRLTPGQGERLPGR